MRFLAADWCAASWTPWAPFDLRNPLFQRLPPGPGVYRVRPGGRDQLAYVGQTGVGVRQRLAMLVRNTLSTEMPWNDPHTAAPSLWALYDAEGMTFECSGAPIDLPRQQREAVECYLLWQYRLEYGASTLCNHGHFHPHYRKSSDRSKGRRGGRLIAEEIRATSRACWPPLKPCGVPADATWMGLAWRPLRQLSTTALDDVLPAPTVYKILAPDGNDLYYIGESASGQTRLRSHVTKQWGDGPALFSFVPLPVQTPSYQRHEVENDLIGSYFAQTHSAPLFQFTNRGSALT